MYFVDDVTFEGLVYVDYLNVSGFINNKNLTDIMENLLFAHDDMKIQEDVTFNAPVCFIFMLLFFY